MDNLIFTQVFNWCLYVNFLISVSCNFYTTSVILSCILCDPKVSGCIKVITFASSHTDMRDKSFVIPIFKETNVKPSEDIVAMAQRRGKEEKREEGAGAGAGLVLLFLPQNTFNIFIEVSHML